VGAVKKGLNHSAFQNYKYMYTHFVKPNFGEMHIVDLKRSDVRAFYNHLSDSQHVKANTIDNIHMKSHLLMN
jgi:hypothetical protein